MTNIEDELRRFYAAGLPPVDPAKQRAVIKLVAQEAQRPGFTAPITTMPFWKFVLTQIRFIDPLCWILQIALIVCVLFAGDTFSTSEIQAPLIMSFAVLTVAIAIPSVFKSFENRTSELELACKFNCAQVLAARLIIFGLADVVWFSIVIALIPSFATSDPFSVFLYAATPFFLFCALCFYLARITNKHVTRATIAAAALLIVVLWQSTSLLPHWYNELSWITWMGALIFAIALTALELHRLLGDMGFVVAPSYARNNR